MSEDTISPVPVEANSKEADSHDSLGAVPGSGSTANSPTYETRNGSSQHPLPERCGYFQLYPTLTTIYSAPTEAPVHLNRQLPTELLGWPKIQFQFPGPSQLSVACYAAWISLTALPIAHTTWNATVDVGVLANEIANAGVAQAQAGNQIQLLQLCSMNSVSLPVNYDFIVNFDRKVQNPRHRKMLKCLRHYLWNLVKVF